MFQVNPLLGMRHEALFSSKDKSKKLKCRLLQFLFDTLRVKPIVQKVSDYPSYLLWCSVFSFLLVYQNHWTLLNWQSAVDQKLSIKINKKFTLNNTYSPSSAYSGLYTVLCSQVFEILFSSKSPSKLTMSLVNVLFKFQLWISKNMPIFFVEKKKWKSFALKKLLSFFQQKYYKCIWL